MRGKVLPLGHFKRYLKAENLCRFMGAVNLTTVRRDINVLKRRISKLEKQLIDPDRILADDDLDALNKAELDYQKGRAKRLA